VERDADREIDWPDTGRVSAARSVRWASRIESGY
jgi:hypothetical protein